MIFEFGDFELDDALFELRRAGQPVSLQPKALNLLMHLVRNRDRAVPKAELVGHLWPAEVVGETSLTRAVRGARVALGDSGSSQAMIRNVRGHGYRFLAVARQSGAERAELVLIQADDPETTAAAPLPAVDQHPFVGREALLSMLDANLRAAIDGCGNVVLLVGEPGIGKTRVALEFARHARGMGVEVLIGNCIEGEGAPAYWPWVNILRQCLASRDKSRVRALMGTGAEDIGQVVPELEQWLGDLGSPPEIESTQARFRFFESLVGFLKRLAAEQPLALVFDDLHRADQPTLLLLRFLAREIEAARVFVLGTYRAPDLRCDPTVARLLSGLARRDPGRCVQVAGLGRHDLVRFLELETGARAPDATVDRLHELTAGNPLFWTQVTTAWRHARGANAEVSLVSWELPEHFAQAKGLHEAIERRLETLSAAGRRMLIVAAVIGREFALGVLSAVTDTHPLQLLETLSEALTTQVIKPTSHAVGHYRFVHGLLPDVLYAQLSASDAAILHHRVGTALEAHYGADADAHVAELAHHFLQGAPAADAERAVDYCLRAAHMAVRQLAYEAAALHCDRALAALALRQESQDDARTASILVGKAEAVYRSNDAVGARLIFERVAVVARRVGSVESLARAAWGIGKMADMGRADPARVALLEEAIAALPARHPRRPGLMAFLAAALLYSGERERRVSLVRSAIQAAREIPDSVALAYALRFGHGALSEPQDLPERLAISSELMHMAASSCAHPVLLGSYATRLEDCLELGDMASVDAAIRLLAERAEQLRQPYLRVQIQAYTAMRATVDGRFDEAEQRTEEAVGLLKRVDKMAAYYMHCALLMAIRRQQGRRAEFAELAQHILQGSPNLSGGRIVLAWVAALNGQRAEAREQLDQLMQNDLAQIRTEPFSLTNLAALAVLSVTVGDPEQSAVLYEALSPYAERVAIARYGFTVHGPVAHCLGLLAYQLGRFDLGARHFEAAILVEHRMGARPNLAETSYEYARALSNRGRAQDRKRAQELIGHAINLAREMGMDTLIEECRAVPLGRAWAMVRQRSG
jgi:DNA-binding winged helix-turn-helix (wHTH) protein/tetratricopeptide (TPR) repeat protein